MTEAAKSLGQNVKSAFRENLLPAIILQIFALSIALCYFFVPVAQGFFESVAALKQEYTWRYSLISTAIFGGVLPFLYLLLSNQVTENKYSLLAFFVGFWAIKGVEVDFLYQFQSWLFGSELDLKTIVKKTLFDQLLYSPFWAAPSIVLPYLWKDSGFSFSRWLVAIKKPQLWRSHMPTMICSNWIIWLPAVSIIYTMPPALQIPLFNLVICFFVLLIATLSKQHK